MRKAGRIFVIAAVACAFVYTVPAAVTKTGQWPASGGTSITNAFDYFDGDNWVDGDVAEGADDIADLFTNPVSGKRYVKASRALTLGKLHGQSANYGTYSLSSANQAIFVGDGP